VGGDKKHVTLTMGMYNRHILCELYVPLIDIFHVNCTYIRYPL